MAPVKVILGEAALRQTGVVPLIVAVGRGLTVTGTLELELLHEATFGDKIT